MFEVFAKFVVGLTGMICIIVAIQFRKTFKKIRTFVRHEGLVSSVMVYRQKIGSRRSLGIKVFVTYKFNGMDFTGAPLFFRYPAWKSYTSYIKLKEKLEGTQTEIYLDKDSPWQFVLGKDAKTTVWDWLIFVMLPFIMGAGCMFGVYCYD